MHIQCGFRRPFAVLGLGLILSGCGGEDGIAPPPATNDGFPPLLSELGVSGRTFEPQYPLWTNGSSKVRTISLPAGTQVDTSDRTSWAYPEGTVLAKTFAYERPEGGADRKIETRIIRVRDGQFETATYLWADDQSDASLLGSAAVSVEVTTAQGNSFTHIVPGANSCRQCHTTSTPFVLGFSELQLNHTPDGSGTSQLRLFADAGLLSGGVPTTPEEIGGDPAIRDMVGYVQGNCVHCHNSSELGDFSHGVFLANTIDQPSRTGGLIVQMQHPDSSAFYRRFATGNMPPLGVEVRDSVMIERVRAWIAGS